MSSSQDFFSRLQKTIHRIVQFALYIGMGWVIVMMLLTTFDVAGRYFLSKPIPGAIEMSEFMLAIFGILGMAYTHQAGANVKVTMLTSALPPRLARLTETITLVLSFQIVAMLVWYGIDRRIVFTLDHWYAHWVFPCFCGFLGDQFSYGYIRCPAHLGKIFPWNLYNLFFYGNSSICYHG